MQNQINKIELGKKKLEDIAKKAAYEIRTKHLTPEFYLHCLSILQKKKFKQYKKLR